jgi:hypothetical protein
LHQVHRMFVELVSEFERLFGKLDVLTRWAKHCLANIKWEIGNTFQLIEDQEDRLFRTS